MATPQLAESTLKKAKEATQEEIDNLCTTISELLTQPDKSSEASSLLRQLFIILQASEINAEPCIPPSLIKSMLHIVSTTNQHKGQGTGSKCQLCQMVISELLPMDNPIDGLHCNFSLEETNVKLGTLSLLQDIHSQCIFNSLPDIVKWLQSQDFEKQKSGLFLMTLVSYAHGKSVQTGVLADTSKKLSQWLSSASLCQAPNPRTLNPFRKDEENSVTEIDGTANTNIFTVLSLGQYYTEDQLLNVFSFSCLYKWILGVSSSLADVSETSCVSPDTEVIIQKVVGALVPKSVDYCLRVLEQSERKAKVQSDVELQAACLIEAVQVLDMVCTLDKGQTAHVFQELKRLNSRLIQDCLPSPALIYILKFYFHHSSTVVHDPRETFRHFFSTIISAQFKDQGLVYDAVEFLYSNLSELADTTNILTAFFPNLFKILAWHPRLFMNEFTMILPAMMNWDTSIEIFHLLLDLPCMTAALEVMEKVKKLEPSTTPIDVEPSNSVDAFNSPRFRPLFNYITRSESGQGDTIDRLSSLHSVLKDCQGSTRVMVCSQLVPILLRIWFKSVQTSEDPAFIGLLIPVILERSGIIYSIPELIEDVHRIFAEELVELCGKFPEIVVHQQCEMAEFLHTTANLAGRLDIYANLIYAVGEYSSLMHTPDCTSDVIGKYYECLEVVTYELLGHLTSPDHDSSIPKIVSTLMSALTKLASRSHDLIPRAILCLTKISKQQSLVLLKPFTKEFLMHRATSLISILKNPDSASMILSPNQEMYTAKWHLNNTSMPSILRGINRLLTQS
ncbi:AP-5 complex subunit zeta-1-like [Physella acuta]|uniref:AP-5 complex subunit zeta-1-like n=1 Tax=Physella acuta TaxID=109671 RepID=UPI0027DB96DB|nr:AP-5 complex subunit zeta-1-like [Physella acuta]